MLTNALLNLLVGPPREGLQADLQDAMVRYLTLKTTEDLVEKQFLQDPLDRENKELDLQMKRAYLGLPEDTASFNEELNTPIVRALGLLGRRGLDQLQSPPVFPKNSGGVMNVFSSGISGRPISRASGGVSTILKRAIGAL